MVCLGQAHDRTLWTILFRTQADKSVDFFVKTTTKAKAAYHKVVSSEKISGMLLVSTQGSSNPRVQANTFLFGTYVIFLVVMHPWSSLASQHFFS